MTDAFLGTMAAGPRDDFLRFMVVDRSNSTSEDRAVRTLSRSIRALRSAPDSPLGAGGTLEERIRQVRARTVGSSGEIPPSAVLAVLDRDGGAGATPGTAHLSPRQQALADEVSRGVGDAIRIVTGLVAPADRTTESDEIEAVRAAITYALEQLSREATSSEPREDVFRNRVLALHGSQGQGGLLADVRRVFEPGTGFVSAADEEQTVRLDLLSSHIRRIVDAFTGFFTPSVAVGVERNAIAAQMRVVADTVEALRSAVRAAGLSVAEASAPSSRLTALSPTLPALPFEQFLDWLAETTGNDAIRQLTASGLFAQRALLTESTALTGHVDIVVATLDGPLTSELAEALSDESVSSELGSLQNQLTTLRDQLAQSVQDGRGRR